MSEHVISQNTWVFHRTALPASCAMLDAAHQRVLSALRFQTAKLHECNDLDTFCHRLHHFAAQVERHRDTLRALGSLRRDTPDFDLMKDEED